MPRLNASQPIVLPDGTMSPHFRDYLLRLDQYTPLTGSGTPEGTVEAPLYSLYLDTAGAAGAVEYRKMSTDIAGDKTKGWLAV